TAPAHRTAPVKQNPAGARRTHAGRHDLCHRARQGANPLAGGRTRAPDRGPPRRTRQTAVWRRHGPGLLGLTLTLLLSPSCREGPPRSPPPADRPTATDRLQPLSEGGRGGVAVPPRPRRDARGASRSIRPRAARDEVPATDPDDDTPQRRYAT